MTKHADCEPPRLILRLLEQRAYRLTRTRPVVCRLWQMRVGQPADRSPQYAIGMETLTSRYLYCVGGDETGARALLARIAEGRLHPIHLGDVVEDYLWELENDGKTEGEFSESPLQSNGNMV
ncbi:MAG: hypothetical protein J6K29_11665 [Clostridia bacterium]|nr:hypothetical protein [Clostridia bacterium]